MKRAAFAVALGCAAGAALPYLTGRNPLATPDQAALDRQALSVLASAPVQSALPFVLNTFGNDPYAATQEGRATQLAAAREVLFAGVVDAIDRDPSRPRLYWLWSPAHRWHGSDMPASKVLMPNVDNVFRIVPVDHASHYRITALPAGPVPTQFSVQLLPALPAEADWSRVIQQIVDSDISKSADGSFILTVGPEAGQANHIVTTEDSHFLLIRDTIQDWARETPYRLAVTRLDGPTPAPPLNDADLANRTAALIRQITPRIQQAKTVGFANAPGFFQGPENTLTSPKIREGGRWGLSSSGHFHLAPDEALLLTLDPIGAKYLAVQLANGWLGSLDYIHHNASLNLSQVRPNADGSVTFVIAATDPGVANWLDTTGLHDGSMFVRWQKLPESLSNGAQGVRDVRLVKLNAIGTLLPPVSPSSRQQQQAARAAAYSRRFAE